MGGAYTPGLQVSRATTVVKVRELPVLGRVLVKLGDKVEAKTAVLAAELPGDLSILRIADRMSADPESIAKGLLVKPEEIVQEGQEICKVKYFFGFFTSSFRSPVSGTVEYFTESNAHLGIRQAPQPLSVGAYVSGVVTHVEEGRAVSIECQGSVIQGIFGVGGERMGVIRALSVRPDRIVTATDLQSQVSSFEGAILIGGSQFDREAIQLAIERGAVAIVTGSIDSISLRNLVGFEIGVSVTGDEEIPLTLIVTEGFGTLPISQSIVALAKELDGKPASVNGATQVRAGAMRPEIIVPGALANQISPLPSTTTSLGIGSRVRIIRVPYFGAQGTVLELPPEPIAIESGAVVRVLEAKLDSGEKVIVPRANIELML